jgi:uncharacterized iron-regulated membrane protein
MEPRLDPLTGKPFAIDFTEIYLDPYSGAERGRRAFGDISQGVKNLMPFIYRFHYSLAIGSFGVQLLGVSALIWTVDSFVGFLLTLPAIGRHRGEARRSWFKRWGLAWRIKFPASAGRVFYDIHRAAGLWLWVLLLIFAWSSVSFNLTDEVYAPVMRLFFVFQEKAEIQPRTPTPIGDHGLDWAMALTRGRELMESLSNQKGFKVDHETWLALDRAQGAYLYGVHSNLDIAASEGQTTITFSAGDGALLAFEEPGAKAGDAVTNWLAALHKARAFGPVYKIAICLFGLGVTALSLTGVFIWWKRVKVRRTQVDRVGRHSTRRRTEPHAA